MPEPRRRPWYFTDLCIVIQVILASAFLMAAFVIWGFYPALGVPLLIGAGIYGFINVALIIAGVFFIVAAIYDEGTSAPK